jgi:indole-3-glycerol phosphate synthase
MNILEQIVADKRKTVALQKERVSVKELESSEGFKRSVISFSAHIRDKNRQGIIAEFKRKSPSRGILNKTAAFRADRGPLFWRQ